MKKRRMMRSKIDPNMFGYIVRRINPNIFIVSVRGQELHASKEFWEEY